MSELVLVQGPLIMQTPQAAALAEVMVKAAERLWDAACEEETPQMWETGREIASWVLSVCHRAEGETARRRARNTVANMPAPSTALWESSATGTDGQTMLPGLAPAHADPG